MINQYKLLIILLAFATFSACGGGGSSSGGDTNNTQNIEEKTVTTMVINTPYTLSKGDKVTRNIDNSRIRIEKNSSSDTSTATLLWGQANITRN